MSLSGQANQNLQPPLVPTRSESKLRDAAGILVVAILYFLAAKLGLSLASVHTNVSPVWPPTGLAIAAILLLGVRAWPGVFIGALLANVLTPVPVAAAIGIAVGNTLEAVAAGLLLRAFSFSKSFDRARHVFSFVFVSLFCTAFAASFGTLSLCFAHSAKWANFGSLWTTWWLGDSVGALIVAPLILTWATRPSKWLPANRQVEAFVIVLLVALSSIATFAAVGPISVARYPFVRLTIPLFLWAAFRLGPRGVTLASIVLSVFAVWGTANGLGPFIGDTANDSLLILQLFIGSNAATFLFLVSVVEERRKTNASLRENERRLAANLAIARILAESPALSVATPLMLETIGESLGWEVGALWELDNDAKVLRNISVWRKPGSEENAFVTTSRDLTFEKGVGLPGRVWSKLRPTWIPNVADDDNFPRAATAVAAGLHAGFAFPISSNDNLLGVMEFFSRQIREPDEPLLNTFESIGRQIGQFIERKTTEEALEFASRLPAENPAPVIRLTEGERVSFANPAADCLLAHWGLRLGDVGPAELVQIAAAVLSTGNKRDIELTLGEQIYLVTFAPVAAANYVNLYFTDISVSKRGEQAVIKSQQALKLAHKVARAGTWQWNLATNSLEWSDEYYELLGLKPEEFPASFDAWTRLVHPDDLPAVLQEHEKAFAQKRDIDAEFRIKRADGQWRWFHRTGRCLYDVDGKPLSVVGITFDITERKEAERGLRQLAAIVESTDDAVIAKDLNGIITSWNSAATRLYGYTPEEVIGKSISILIPADRPDEEPAILETLRRGEPIDHFETIRISKDARRIDVSLTVSPIRDSTGKVVGASKIARDISEQRRAQEERERLLARERAAREEAEVASRAKDEFLAVLSHELRTPLTAMLGWLSILRDHQLDQQTTEHAIETIERNAKAQAQLIEDLVDISRIVGGKLHLEVRPISLLPVINAAVDVVRPAADAKNIHIDVDFDASVGHISGDTSRLQQVIWNLLSNAVKFTPNGGSISVEFRKAGSSAELIIRDDGAGISADFLPHVFERFRQAESAITRSHRGMGLGLAIVRHLVELHGGSVEVHSDGENRGATFTISLPLAVVNDVEPAAAEQVTEVVVPLLNGVRILLVEDEPDARELISLILRGSGADVEAVDSVGDALQRLPLFIPDVLLSDIGLPIESGYDLIRKVRSLPTNLNRVPAVALTAFATEADRKMSLTAGFQAHLAKPVEAGYLVHTIKGLINGHT